MAYQEINQYNSPNYTPGNSANAVWGQGNRVVKSITIHWWGDPAQRPTFENTINYLCRQGGNTSAHVIAEAGRVAWIVNGTDCAWHAGNAYGNTTSIGIECNPRASDGDYSTIAELVRDIRKIYGDIPLVPHRDWQATACPGVYDLAKIDRLARNAYVAPKPAPKPATPSTPYKAPTTAPKPSTAASAWTGRPVWFVEKGDTLGKIAKYYGVSVSQIAAFNGIKNVNALTVGEKVFPPSSGRLVWIVDPGETLTSISKSTGASIANIVKANAIKNANVLKLKDRLIIP